MNFINKIILIIAVGIINLIHAQNIDNKAKGILDAVSANYKSKNTLYFKFSYGTGSGKISKNQTGSFYASKDKYKLKIMGNEQIFDGNLASLKRFKDDVKEVATGYECGLVFEKFNDIKEFDQVEAYAMVEVPRS